VTTDVEAAVAQAFRDELGRVVATLIRVTGDWDLAEKSPLRLTPLTTLPLARYWLMLSLSQHMLL
jgi:hypothetical protein